MKQKAFIKLWAAICGLIVSNSLAFSQGTAFTYQGLLTSGGSPVTGLYDLTNALYNSASGGGQVGPTITLSAVPVTNGLFTVLLDFGAVFNGTSYWLQIGVRSNGAGAYIPLSPRQQLTPAPYAITAENVDGPVLASQLSGTLPSGQLSGVYSNALNFNNAGNNFVGNGGGLTGLNASQLTSGAVPDGRLSPNVALLNANQTFTGVNTFTGPGKSLIVDTGPISTNLFTGLGFQYNSATGEGALMSSFNNGYGFLSFYTKAGSGLPLQEQVVIDKYGGVAIDQGNYNAGFLNNGNTNGAGLTFGVGSGAGLASKRTPGGNQDGLDFYTSFINRMSIQQSGFVGIGRQTPVSGADLFAVRSPAMAGLYGGMYIDTAGVNALPFYGYAMNGTAYAWTYLDGSDGNKWKLNNSGTHLTVTPAGLVGVNTTTPSGQLDVESTVFNGIYVNQPALNANGIYAVATNGTATVAVYGQSPPGFGIYGDSIAGTGVYGYSGSGRGVDGESNSGPGVYGLSGSGAGVYGESSSGPGVYASSSGSGPALTIGNGGLRVAGAGIDTTTAAFLHIATDLNSYSGPSNWCGGTACSTRIINSLCDGNPNALLIATHHDGVQGSGFTIGTHPHSLLYDPGEGHWAIVLDDGASIVGHAFNVLVVTP